MNGRLFFNALKGMAAGLAAALIFVLIFNFIALKSSDPDRQITVFAYIAEAVGAAACGIAAGRFNREQGLAAGGIAGAMYVTVLFLGACITSGSVRFVPAVIVGICAAVLSSFCGVIGLPKDKSPRARKKSMMNRARGI